MKWLLSALFVFILFVPAFSASTTPSSFFLDANQAGEVQGKFILFTSAEETCEFASAPAQLITLSDPAQGAKELAFSFFVPANHTYPYYNELKFNCKVGDRTSLLLIPVNVMKQGNPQMYFDTSAIQTFFTAYSEPLPYLYAPEEKQYLDYPYFYGIGTGFGLDWIIGGVVAVFVFWAFWQVLNT